MNLRIVSFLLLLIPISTTWAYSSFARRIPNGANVVSPDGTRWPAVGHQAPSRGAFLNAFGQDFKDAGLQWTVGLCQKDSDNDGRTNGQELGDPMCQWNVGDVPTFQENITHPGMYNQEFSGVEEEDVPVLETTATKTLQMPSWLQWHIACMMLSWGFLLPVGALMAISFRHAFADKARWFHLHIGIQISGVALNIAGFAIPYVNLSVHFQQTHNILGTVVFAIGIAQAVQGFIRPSKPATNDEQPSMLRRVWEVCHKGFGRIVIVLAWANTFLGIKLVRDFYEGVDGNGRVIMACKALLGIQIALCVLLTAVAIFYRSKPREAATDDKDEINETTRTGSNEDRSQEDFVDVEM